jgi:His Kinase A (phospho-acceptor) domain
MNWNRPAWWPHLRRSRISQEPGAALFQGLRVRLTLWYCGVLGAALILFGVALYVGTQHFLITPVANDTQGHTAVHENEWLSGQVSQACPLLNQQGPFGPFPGQGQGFQMPEQVVCFGANGTLLSGQNTSQLPTAFLSNTLVKTALQTGQSASDIIDAGGSIGQIYRYALVVPNPAGGGYLGVLLVGEPVQAEESALSLLMNLLLSVGGVALLGAGAGGLFLSNRALAPARLSWANQQRFIADAAHELRTPLTLLRAVASAWTKRTRRCWRISWPNPTICRT